MSKAPTITLSMFWPLLLFAAETYAESSVTVQRAVDRLLADHHRLSVEIDADTIAEELAREHFPTGAVGNVGWDGSDPNAAWWADDELYESFLEVSAGLEEVTGGKLSPTDPAHVAMVARVIAISVGIEVCVEPPHVRIELDVEREVDSDESATKGYMVCLTRARPHSTAKLRATGHFFPYAADQTAETVDYGAALFAWFLVRHAEIVAYFEAQSPDPSGAVPNPGPTAT